MNLLELWQVDSCCPHACFWSASYQSPVTCSSLCPGIPACLDPLFLHTATPDLGTLSQLHTCCFLFYLWGVVGLSVLSLSQDPLIGSEDSKGVPTPAGRFIVRYKSSWVISMSLKAKNIMELKRIKNKSSFSSQARIHVVDHVLYTSLHCSYIWKESCFHIPWI